MGRKRKEEESELPIEKEEQKIAAEENQTVKHGVILTGGMDSTVMLCKLKHDLPDDAEIIPIVIGTSKKDVTPILNKLEISTASKAFSDIDNTDVDEAKMLPVLEWAIKNKVNVIHFAANHDEQQNNIPGKTFDYFARLNALTDIRINAPLIGVTKEEIIKWAVDDYGIDLNELAQPIPIEEGDIIGEKYQRIRRDGFKQAFSTKQNKFIVDPFAEEEK